MRRLSWPLALFACLTWLSGDLAAEERPAQNLAVGSIAHDRLVALGQDLVIDGEARSQAVALNGNIEVGGRIDGDVIVLGGDVRLKESARVQGDIYILGGRLDAAAGASIGGRSVAFPEASALWLTLIEGPALGQDGDPQIVLGAKLALLAFWIFLTLLLFSVAARELLNTSESIRTRPFANFALGLTGVAAMVLTALLFSALSGALLGVPLLVFVAVIALLLRFWGMVAIFHALGYFLLKRLKVADSLPIKAATVGLIALGVLKLMPYIGLWTWTLATFIGVGAALRTRLGREAAW